MPKTFPCPACGAPVDPAPNQNHMPCPYCSTALTIPAKLRWKQAIAPELPPAEKPTFDPFKAAQNAQLTGKQTEKKQIETEFFTNALRQAQPLAAGAVSAYALWASLRRILPGCLIALVIFCVFSCGIGAAVIFTLRQGG